MKKVLCFSALAGLLSSQAVIAEAPQQGLFGDVKANHFTYNYIEVGFIDVDEFEVDGLRLRGSYDVDPNMAIIGTYSSADSSSLDFTQLTLGVAYHQAIEGTQIQNTDMVIHAELEKIDVEIDTPGTNEKEDESGILIGAGIRNNAITDLELFADLSLRTAGDNDFLFTGGAYYSLIPEFQLGASLEVSDQDTLSLSMRFNF